MRGRREEGNALSPLLWGNAIWTWVDGFFDVFGAGSAWWMGPWGLVSGEEAAVFPVRCALGLVGPSRSWFGEVGLAGGPVMWFPGVVGLRTDTGVQRGGSPPRGPLPACISGVAPLCIGGTLNTPSACALSFLFLWLLTVHVSGVVSLTWGDGVPSVSAFPVWCWALLVAVSLTMGARGAFLLEEQAGFLVGPFVGGVCSRGVQ